MLLETYVALDVETTGLDPDRDRITEVGLVRCDAEGNVLDTFESLVNPGREIPLFIERLTGVTNDAVSTAPALGDIAPALVGFVGTSPVVGQNVGFDLACLRREGVTFDVPVIDTASLSRFLMPERQARGLLGLAESLEVERGVHHRALPDARMAAGIFAALLQRAASLPEIQRNQLARLVAIQDQTLAGIIAGDAHPLPGEASAPPALRPAPAYPPLIASETVAPTRREEVDLAFASAPTAIPRFEAREEQHAMAEAVRDVMSRGGHVLIEAGTGVGKSLAYLIPAALHALRNGQRVVISTNTIALQEQLLQKDIPALKRLLQHAGIIDDEDDLRAALLKGRGNYLCLRRWIASYGSHLADPDFASLAANVLLWLPETETGDRSELSLGSDEWVTWQRFSAQDTDCLTRQHALVREGSCFLLRSRKAAESAHLVIVNHALLLADIASGGSALPAYDHLIVDEAHNLEDTATKQFGGTVSRRTLSEALDAVHRPAGRGTREGGVVTLLRAFPAGSGLDLAGRALQDAVAEAWLRTGPFLDALGGQSPREGDEDRVLVDRSTRARASWTKVEETWEALDRALRALANKASVAQQAVRDGAAVEEPDVLAGEVESATRKVEDVRLLLARLISSNDDSEIVWIARERDGGGSINAAPLEVGPTLWEQLFMKKRTVVATSATLSAGGDMAFAARALGLESPRTVQLGSPYDYERAVLLAAFSDVAEPSDPAYAGQVASAVTKLVTASEGRALALFTSHAAVREAYALVKPELESQGIAVLAQGIDGNPRQLIDNLRQTQRTVVLGTSSFWEGVDVRGSALSMLIIARLPFAVPTDPVHRARAEQFSDPFGSYSLPSAILRFRQGFGRLIRDRDDRGVVAVLDRRIYEKRYGPDFVDALPRCTMIRADAATVSLRASEWLHE